LTKEKKLASPPPPSYFFFLKKILAAGFGGYYFVRLSRRTEIRAAFSSGGKRPLLFPALLLDCAE